MDLSFVTRKFQRSIAGLSLLAILASFAGFTGTAFAKTFSDVSSSSFAYDQIDALSDAGIMTGVGDGTLFDPNGYTTREQVAKVLVEAFVGSVDTSYDAGFSDVMDGQWYTDYVNTAALYGIFSGNPDGTFGVGDYINRADLAKTVVAAAGLESSIWGSDKFSDVSVGSYYDSAVGTAWAYTVVDGTSSTTYNPGGNATREQLAKIVYNSMNPVYRGDDTGTDNGNTGSADATVMVEVSDDTPEADTLPSNATSVELASFDFTAEGDDSELDGLTVHQYGISTVPSGATVYLYNGASRLTSGTTVNSTTHESDFRNLNVELPEGETVTLTVRMDMGTWGSTGEVGFEIASADKVDAGESAVEGDFPAMGDKFSVSNTSVGTVTVEKNGTVDNSEVGADDVYVAKFKLTAGSTEGGYVQEVGLYVSGSVSTTDVENLRLYVTGNDAEPIAQVDSVDDLDVARFVVGEGEGVMEDMEDGYHLEKGDSKSFYVLADLNTGRTDDTVKAYIDQNTDLRVVGDLYNYGMAVSRTATSTPAGSYDGTSCTSSSGNCTFQTLKGGDITVSSNGPAATDVAINGKDVTLLNFVVTSVTDVTFDNFPLLLTATESADTTEGLLNNTAANFTDIKIVDTDTGSQLYSSVDATSLTSTLGGSTFTDAGGDTTGYYLWTDDWYVDAGSEYNLSVKTDVANTSTLDTMTITASLPFDSTYPVLKDANNKIITNSSSFVPTSTITGKTMTVRAPSLALSLASSPASGSNIYVKGTQDVPFTGIVFACGKSTSCKVTSMTLQGYLDDNGNASAFSTTTGADHGTNLSSYVGSVWLEDSDGNTVAGSKNVSNTDSTVQFTNLNWSIGAGDTEILYVVGNIATDAFKNSNAENIAFGISSASNVSVENADGNSFSATGTVNTSQTTYVTTSQGGTLAFSVSGSTPRENIQVAGSTDVEVANFTLTSTREAFMVDTLSVNNRQGATDGTNGACVTVAAPTCLGNYDHNVSRLKLTYTDADGASQSAYAYLTSGTAQFTGLELYVPKDSSTTIKVYADLQPIASSGSTATAGQWVDLALAFDSFNATSQGSGSTFNAGQFDASNLAMTIDNGTGAGNSLFSTLTFSNTGAFLVDGGQDKTASHTVGNTTTLVIDNNGAVTSALPVGAFICMDANNGGTCATEDIWVVTARTSGATEDTYSVRLADDAGNGNYSDNIQVLYALPGTGYFTSTNRQQVYKTKPTLTLDASSPSGSRSVSTSDDAFIFDIYAATNEKVSIRTAQINDATTNTTGFGSSTALAGTWTAGTGDTRSTVSGGGIGNTDFQRSTEGGNNQAGLIFTFTSSADLSGYKGMSYWARSSDNTNGFTITVDGSGTDQTSATGNFVANTWTFVDMPFTSATANYQGVTLISFLVTDGSGVAAATYDVDRVALYYEKITVNIAADANIDTNTGNGADNLVATLKQGGSTVATGYFYSSTQGANASTGSITFYPQAGVDSQIDIDKGTTKAFTLNTSTSALLNEQSGVDDHLTFSIGLGSSTDGTVTAGDFWWFDNSSTTTATVKWVGKTDSSFLTSNTVSY